MKIFSFLKPAPHIERVPADQVDQKYKEHQYRNFLGIFIGYACYYLLRKNASLALPFLVEQGFTKAQLGWVLAAVPMSYGISKFIMGNFSDRSNPRYFIVTGLIISVIANLVFGFVGAITTSLTAMFCVMLVNGCVQGMGSPPCYRTVAHWFPISKKGRTMAVWNISHNIGAAILGGLAVITIPYLGWKSIFYAPAVIALLCSIIMLILMRDTPQSVGLMPIEEYSNEYPDNKGKDIKDREKELTAKEILFKYVLVNKYVWFLGLAAIFVYFIRYGILDWAPTYLTEVKGLDVTKGGVTFFIYEMAGIPGMLLCGYVSDKIFKGRRAPVSILCMITVCAGILFYWLSPNIYLNYMGLFLVGMFVYGPVMLLGVQILDIMPKKAVGTTIGLIGLFGYWGGNMSASVGAGYIIEYLGWDGAFATMIVCCSLAILFFSFTLRIKKKVPALEAEAA